MNPDAPSHRSVSPVGDVPGIAPPPAHSLVSLLLPHAIPMPVLHRRYGALMELVRTLIGVVPNCDRYLEIWPPAFQTYNLVVPNLMNLPATVFGVGGAPKALVGLSMVVASRAADCPYCTAHTCSFALRRGATPETIASALRGAGPLSTRESAVVEVATALGSVPTTLTADQKKRLLDHFSPAQAEWIAMGAVAMGFLNKFMDATGVELEETTTAEVATTLGKDWTPGRAGWALGALSATPPPAADTLRSKLRILRFLPRALLLDTRWQRGVPRRWPKVRHYLKREVGHDFPVLGKLIHQRTVRAIAAVLGLNLNPASTVLSVRTKILAGVVFCHIVGAATLARDIEALARHHGLSDTQLQRACAFALGDSDSWAELAPTDLAALHLARAAAPSPAQVNQETVQRCSEASLPAPALVEMVCWLSVLQMLNRLTAYCDAEV